MACVTQGVISIRTIPGLVLAALVLTACASGGGPAQVIDRSYDRRAPAPVEAGTHLIARGETVYGIAQRYGVSTRALIDWNSLRPPYRLIAGERIRLPESQGYVVQRGDTVHAISRRFGVDQSTLVRTNNIRPPYTIQAGQRLQLPANATAPSLPPEAQTASAPIQRTVLPPPSSAPSPGSPPATAPGAATRPSTETPPSRAATTIAVPPPPAASGFIWPVEGRLLSSFGAKDNGLHNDGINIAAPRGAPVVAADNGVVAYAGQEIRGFGNLLLIKHDGGLITAYAHTDTLLVGRGDIVTRGQVIGKVGTTGGVDTPQLHFEVRQGTRAVDPKRYLPG